MMLSATLVYAQTTTQYTVVTPTNNGTPPCVLNADNTITCSSMSGDLQPMTINDSTSGWISFSTDSFNSTTGQITGSVQWSPVNAQAPLNNCSGGYGTWNFPTSGFDKDLNYPTTLTMECTGVDSNGAGYTLNLVMFIQLYYVEYQGTIQLLIVGGDFQYTEPGLNG